MSNEIKDIVRDKYAKVVEEKSGCCTPSCCGSDEKVETIFHHDYSKVDGYVKDADLQLGCGIPTEHAAIKEGDTVLDLGSGAGNDVFVARQLTGPSGRVVGIDFTEQMVKKANENKAKLGLENVEFVLGDIEDMPLPDQLADVVISNCVMNLVPDKKAAFREVQRVLKTGGHFSISDIVVRGELSEAVRNAAALYAGCVSGALQMDDYLGVIEKAGFSQVEVVKERQIELPDELLLQHLKADEVQEFRDSGVGIFSITVKAVK